MNERAKAHVEKYPDGHHDVYSKTIFGFWLYLLSDFMLFATLFATYIVLQTSAFGGPLAHEIITPSLTLFQTLVLLTSSLTIGLAGVFAHRRNANYAIVFSGMTLVLGVMFVWMELNEFSRLVGLGYDWQKSAFLSAFFTLIGTHGLHVVFAILWIFIFVIPVCFSGITPVSIRRITCLRMFWQFLNIIWIFIFTIVYLLGAVVYD